MMHGCNGSTAAQVPAPVCPCTLSPRAPVSLHCHIPVYLLPCPSTPISLHPCPISLCPCNCVSLSVPRPLCLYLCVPPPAPSPLHVPAALVSLHPCVPPPAPRHPWASTGDSSVLCPCAQQWLCVPWAVVLAVSCSMGDSGDRNVTSLSWILPALGSLGCSHCRPHRESAIPTGHLLYSWTPGPAFVPAEPVQAGVTLGPCSRMNP